VIRGLRRSSMVEQDTESLKEKREKAAGLITPAGFFIGMDIDRVVGNFCPAYLSGREQALSV
jgi:hypothetical protein